MIDRAAYLNALKSQKWTRDANCWAFVLQVCRDLFGCESLPLIEAALVDDKSRRTAAFAGHPARTVWRNVETPADGDLVIMTRPGDLHAGIFLVTDGRGRVWHRDVHHGLADDTLMEITELRRWKPQFLRKHA